jgi:hypothetical protein
MTDGKKDSVSARFMDYLIGNFNQRVARCWSRFAEFLEIFYVFAAYSPEEIAADAFGFTTLEVQPQSEAFKVGMTYFFSVKMLEKIGDFILGAKSPFLKVNEERPKMGGSMTSAKLDNILKLFHLMMQQQSFIDANPFSEDAKKMFEKKEMLSKLLEPSKDGEPNALVISMCTNNVKMSMKVAKSLIKNLASPANADKIGMHLKSLHSFMVIDDSLKQHRLEWVLGVP